MTGRATSTRLNCCWVQRNVRSVSTDVQGRNGKARTKECEGHKKECDGGGDGGRKESGRAASVTLYFCQFDWATDSLCGLGWRESHLQLGQASRRDNSPHSRLACRGSSSRAWRQYGVSLGDGRGEVSETGGRTANFGTSARDGPKADLDS